MKFRRLLVCVLFAAPALSFAASKEIQELQRDVGLLQQDLKALKSSQDKQFVLLLELTRQAADYANKANSGTTGMQNSLAKSLEDQQKQVVGPVVGLGTRMDNVSNDVRTLQQAVSDMVSMMTKMQSQLNDLTTAVKAINIAPVPPPPQPGTTAGGTPGGAPPQGVPP